MPTLTTLIENTQSPTTEALTAEHGLSLHLQHPEATILFDTGQTGDFLTNANHLGTDLIAIDHVILSHAHYDHANGLPRLLTSSILSAKADLIVGEEFFHLKYKELPDGTFTYIGPSLTEQEIKDTGIPIRRIASETTYLTDHILLFHHFTQSNDFEHLNQRFILHNPEAPVKPILPKSSVACPKPVDTFQDELALGIITDQGLVVIVGCSHIGIINILTDIQNRVNLPIHMVIGGTHLIAADEERIEKTIQAMKQLGVQKIAVSHCTGELATNKLKEAFGNQFISNNTGNVIRF